MKIVFKDPKNIPDTISITPGRIYCARYAFGTGTADVVFKDDEGVLAQVPSHLCSIDPFQPSWGTNNPFGCHIHTITHADSTKHTHSDMFILGLLCGVLVCCLFSLFL